MRSDLFWDGVLSVFTFGLFPETRKPKAVEAKLNGFEEDQRKLKEDMRRVFDELSFIMPQTSKEETR